jgi:hypothetical protein
LFEDLFNVKHDICDSYAIKEGEIGNIGTEKVRQQTREKHLKNSTVTIVLIGKDTWRRKHVDYEIYASLRQTKNNPRSGLLGIILPTYNHEPGKFYNPKTIPKRLNQNIENGFADIIHWTENHERVQKFIHEAFEKRDKKIPNNQPKPNKNNLKGSHW